MKTLICLNQLANVGVWTGLIILGLLIGFDLVGAPIVRSIRSDAFLEHWLYNVLVLLLPLFFGVLAMYIRRVKTRRGNFDFNAALRVGIGCIVAALVVFYPIGFFSALATMGLDDARVTSWYTTLFSLLLCLLTFGCGYADFLPRFADVLKAIHTGQTSQVSGHLLLVYGFVNGCIGAILLSIGFVGRQSGVNAPFLAVIDAIGVLLLVKAVSYLGRWLGRSA
jgi:hypothetical protein